MEAQDYEVSLLAWGKDGVRLVGRTKDKDTVELVLDTLRRELDGDRGAGAAPAGVLRVIRSEEGPQS